MGMFRSRKTTTRADRISDFQINTASYGEIVPEILGTTRVSGNVIYWDDFTAHEHRDVQRTGKGGRSKMVNITYTYSVAVAIALCEGPIAGVGKVWRNQEIYTYPASDIEMTLFDGSLGQSPWPYVKSKHPEKALPYSGLAYMAGVVDLGTGGSLPNFNFEVRGKLLGTGDGIDVNPADYIAYVMEQVGVPASNIEGLDNYRRYCAAADLLISSPPDSSEKQAQAIINDIADLTNAYVFWSHDRLKIVPLADSRIGDWSPDREIKYDLTADDFLPNRGALVTYKRKDSSESFNQSTVEFLNRVNGYEKETVSFDIVADVQRNGLRPAPLKMAHYFYTKERAAYVAEQLAMRQLYARNQYTFKLDWAFCRLEPGDLVTLTDDACQLNRRVVVITSVKEAADGELEITAIGKPPGIYSPARYDVHETERPHTDYNAPAPSINDLLIIQPPVDLTLDGNELWLGVTAPNGWGGCNVWISDSGDEYKLLGNLNRQARIGELVSAMSATATECEVKLKHGELKSGTPVDAERGNTVCWIDGECVSYETATLQTSGAYKLGGLIRGQYSTKAAEHSAGTKFCRIDEALLRQRYRDEDIGKRIFIKCTSLNMFGGQEEDIADVEAYEYVVNPYHIPDVTNLTLFTRYHDLGRGVKSYDVVAQFEPPNLAAYDTAEAWYRKAGGEWKYGGSGDGQMSISGCELGETYEVKVQTKDIYGHYSQGVTKSILVEMKAEVPNTPRGFSVTFSDRAYFDWLEVVNADVDFYELRIDTNPGATDGLIGRSNNTTYAGTVTRRTGTVYLYAHNPSKGYSAPATVDYNIPKPATPTELNIVERMSGFSVSVPPIPPMCRGMTVYVDGEAMFVPTNTVFVGKPAGVYRVKVAYSDIIGESDPTNEATATVKATIPPEMIGDESLSMSKVDQALKAQIESGGAAGEQVTQIVTALNGNPSESGYSALTQLNDAVNLRVAKGDVINQINIGNETTTIDGKYLHVTGQTVFDDDVIVSGMIQANAVTAKKMSVDSLSAITATIGTLRTATTGARTEIKDNLIEVYDASNQLRVRMGVW